MVDIAVPLRVPRFPVEPLIVFSAAQNSAEALQAQRVDSLMTSFEYIKSNPEAFHRQHVQVWDTWPTRRYLDSGIFTLMAEAGTTRITSKKRAGAASTRRARMLTLAQGYCSYLVEYHQLWDHVANLDCDNIPELGPELAQRLTNKLTELVGDKLMPVWHPEIGVDGWTRMVAKYPYVAIGSDEDMTGNFPFVRELVREAHASSVLVHLMGTAGEDIMLATEADSADTSAWTSSIRHGSYSGINFSERESRGGQRISSRTRAFALEMELNGIDTAQLLVPGKNIHKLRAGILGLQQRERRVRAAFHRRNNTQHA